jgi:hypothetical protein
MPMNVAVDGIDGEPSKLLRKYETLDALKSLLRSPFEKERVGI